MGMCKHCKEKTFLTYFHTCTKERVPPFPGGTFVYPDSWYEGWHKHLLKQGWTKKELKQGWRYRK